MGVVWTDPVTCGDWVIGITVIRQNVAYMAILASAHLQGHAASHLQPRLAIALGQ